MTAEWRSLTGRFHTFIAGLQPMPLERRRAVSAAHDVAVCLRARLRDAVDLWAGDALPPGPSWPAEDHFLVGGVAKGTALAPLRMVDLLFLLPNHLRHLARPNDGGMANLTAELAPLLHPTFATSLAPDGRWLTARSFDEMAVRLVPGFRTAGDSLLVAAPDPPGSWQAVHPQAEAMRLREADLATSGKATHLILMLKAWRHAHDVPLDSLALELMVTEFVLVWNYPRRGLLFYDWMLRDFFFWAVHQKNRQLLTPGALENIDLGAAWVQAAEQAHRHAEHASCLERDNRDAEAVEEWRAIFGPTFTGALPATEAALIASPAPRPALRRQSDSC